MSCELCTQVGGRLIHRAARWRVVGVDDAAFPGFYRVIWNTHVAEWTDLPPAERSLCMQVVAEVETALRQTLRPTKINLASLGNVVPHLHWHVVARFDWDSRFPKPVWDAPQRPPAAERLAGLRAALPALDARLAEALASIAD